MNQISIGKLDELINRTEVTELTDMTEEFQKKYEENYHTQNRIVENFNNIVQFLIDNPDKPFDIFIEKQDAQTTQVPVMVPADLGYIQQNVAQTIPAKEIYLHVNKDGFFVRDRNSQWGGVDRFQYFTPTWGLKSGYSSFLKVIFGYPKVYDDLYPHLSEHGKDLFVKLKNKYHSLYFNQIDGKWTNYKILNLEEDEKKILNFSTEIASLTFHSRRSDINVFIGNDRSPKGTPRPIFNPAVFDKRRGEREQFVYEKIFIINHYSDIRRGFENFKSFELPKVDSHLEFIRTTNELISKFVILKKL